LGEHLLTYCSEARQTLVRHESAVHAIARIYNDTPNAPPADRIAIPNPGIMVGPAGFDDENDAHAARLRPADIAFARNTLTDITFVEVFTKEALLAKYSNTSDIVKTLLQAKQNKIAKYSKQVTALGKTFIPLVFNVFGAMEASSETALRALVAEVDEHGSKWFRMRTTLSATAFTYAAEAVLAHYYPERAIPSFHKYALAQRRRTSRLAPGPQL
jgi:hypothetical protein